MTVPEYPTPHQAELAGRAIFELLTMKPWRMVEDARPIFVAAGRAALLTVSSIADVAEKFDQLDDRAKERVLAVLALAQADQATPTEDGVDRD